MFLLVTLLAYPIQIAQSLFEVLGVLVGGPVLLIAQGIEKLIGLF